MIVCPWSGLVLGPEGVVSVEVSMFEQWVFNKASLNVHNFSSVGPITSLELDLSDYVLKSNVYFGLFLTKYHGPCGLFLARSKFEI